mgnify:FL=1
MCTNTHKSIEVRKENKIKLNFEKSDVAFKTSKNDSLKRLCLYLMHVMMVVQDTHIILSLRGVVAHPCILQHFHHFVTPHRTKLIKLNWNISTRVVSSAH